MAFSRTSIQGVFFLKCSVMICAQEVNIMMVVGVPELWDCSEEECWIQIEKDIVTLVEMLVTTIFLYHSSLSVIY